VSNVDPIGEYFELCKDVDGSFHPDKVRYALACAYRGGFLEAVDLYRGRLQFEPRCSVPSPGPVTTEKAQKALEDRVLAELQERGILLDQKAVDEAREKLNKSRS
jgi:hypothetical protein